MLYIPISMIRKYAITSAPRHRNRFSRADIEDVFTYLSQEIPNFAKAKIGQLRGLQRFNVTILNLQFQSSGAKKSLKILKWTQMSCQNCLKLSYLL
jgi:hypothetical protein